jgi:putative FmdB family regulatory protein
MPIYEYQCGTCKASYELRQGFDADTTHTCEECGKGIAKRVLHAPPIVFKGSGWYVTDSKKSSSALSESKKSDDTGTTESVAPAKAEKPAAKDSGPGPEAAAAS